jgi:Trypsin-co-occurring domain 1
MNLVPITLDDNTIIYVQADEEPDTLPTETTDPPRSGGRVAKGGELGQVQRSFQSIQSTITGYTRYALDAFKELGDAHVEKITLEFSIKVAGKAGIPYITEGSAEGNLKVVVECSLPKTPGT